MFILPNPAIWLDVAVMCRQTAKKGPPRTTATTARRRTARRRWPPVIKCRCKPPGECRPDLARVGPHGQLQVLVGRHAWNPCTVSRDGFGWTQCPVCPQAMRRLAPENVPDGWKVWLYKDQNLIASWDPGQTEGTLLPPGNYDWELEPPDSNPNNVKSGSIELYPVTCEGGRE